MVFDKADALTNDVVSELNGGGDYPKGIKKSVKFNPDAKLIHETGDSFRHLSVLNGDYVLVPRYTNGDYAIFPIDFQSPNRTWALVGPTTPAAPDFPNAPKSRQILLKSVNINLKNKVTVQMVTKTIPNKQNVSSKVNILFVDRFVQESVFPAVGGLGVAGYTRLPHGCTKPFNALKNVV